MFGVGGPAPACDSQTFVGAQPEAARRQSADAPRGGQPVTFSVPYAPSASSE